MLAVFIVVGIGVVALSPETAQARPGALASIRPRVAVHRAVNVGSTERGGRRLPYLHVYRILIKMAEAFFSSLWWIRELCGGADIYAGRYRGATREGGAAAPKTAGSRTRAVARSSTATVASAAFFLTDSTPFFALAFVS
jgi:hypothetical protein